MTFTLQDALKREKVLARKEARLLDLIELKAGPRRLAKLDEITDAREANQRRLDRLMNRRDEVSYELFENDLVTGVKVTVKDTMYDETFEGGQGAQLYLSGTSDYKGFGLKVDLIPESFAQGTKTYVYGTSSLVDRLDGSFDVTASLIQGDNTIFTETII